jgi:hypothetical protein
VSVDTVFCNIDFGIGKPFNFGFGHIEINYIVPFFAGQNTIHPIQLQEPIIDSRRNKMFTFGAPEDFQLQQAINFLDGKPRQKAVAKPKAVSATEPSGGAAAKK